MIKELVNKIKSIDIQTLKEEAVWQNRDLIIEANKAQLHSGKTSKGDVITPLYRAKSYAEWKATLASYEADNYVPDLFVTGEFYEGFDLEIGNGEYDIWSRDAKTDDLAKKYADIFGLTQENIKKCQEKVTETFITLLKEKLNN